MGIALLISGCKSKPAGDFEIKPAPIHEVDVRFAESFPVQVFVYIKGGLPDGCTTLRDLKTTRNDETITIDVTVQRPKEAICTQVYGFFEKNVALGSDFSSGKAYTLKVNDVTKTFTMQ
jgi:hypothetical protein